LSSLNHFTVPVAIAVPPIVSQRIFQQVDASFGTAVLSIIPQRQTEAHPGHRMSSGGGHLEVLGIDRGRGQPNT
jgi:hypothetical protein